MTEKLFTETLNKKNKKIKNFNATKSPDTQQFVVVEHLLRNSLTSLCINMRRKWRLLEDGGEQQSVQFSLWPTSMKDNK